MLLSGTLGKALHEDVVALRLGFTVGLLGAFHVSEHLELLSLKVATVGLSDGLGRVLLLSELHVSKAAGKAVSEALKLAFLNFSKLGVHVVDLLLGH